MSMSSSLPRSRTSSGWPRWQVAIETELGRLDVVQGLDGIPTYEELRSRATQAEILGVSVAACSIDDLKAMKRAAGRTRDLADLEDLEAAND
jgi:predicted nucleotidyltransferase